MSFQQFSIVFGRYEVRTRLSLYTGHVDMRMISKSGGEIYEIFTNGQDFHCLSADISLMQKIQKNNIRKIRKSFQQLFLDKKYNFILRNVKTGLNNVPNKGQYIITMLEVNIINQVKMKTCRTFYQF